MTIISLPTTTETVRQILKHDEEIFFENANIIVTIDAKEEVTVWDKHKMLCFFPNKEER